MEPCEQRASRSCAVTIGCFWQWNEVQEAVSSLLRYRRGLEFICDVTFRLFVSWRKLWETHSENIALLKVRVKHGMFWNVLHRRGTCRWTAPAQEPGILSPGDGKTNPGMEWILILIVKSTLDRHHVHMSWNFPDKSLQGKLAFVLASYAGPSWPFQSLLPRNIWP